MSDLIQKMGRAMRHETTIIYKLGYTDVNHATLMAERVKEDDWTQQQLADRQAGNPPYVHITRIHQ